jgi:DnaJ-class molecular chaperone
MIFKDYYKILGFDDNRATPEEIKIAYREQAKKYHPDVNGRTRNTEERFKDINEAYRTLSNQTSRKKYDRAWKINIGRQRNKERYGDKNNKSDSFIDSLIGMLFGNNVAKRKERTKNVPRIKGEDIETEIEISLQEAFYGIIKKITLRTVQGKPKTITVKIPAGIRNNERIRLIGQGKKTKKDEKPGDLFIKVKVLKDEEFILKGYDIYKKISITPWEAVLGTKKQINGIDSTEEITIEEYTTTGEKIVIENKGFRSREGKRGNLICEVKISIPKNMTSQEIQKYKELKEICNR